MEYSVLPKLPSVDGEDLMIGARPIAKFLFERDDRGARHKLYTLIERDRGLPVFKIGKQLAARRSALRAEWERREREKRGDAA
jgi:hypothetical protein